LAERLGAEDQSQAVDRLQAMPLFADADRDALQAIGERLVLRHYPAGEIIYAEGTPGDAMYFCEAGRVKLVSDAATESEFLERVNPGESFGEMALLTGRTRAEAAKAIEDTTLWVLYKTEYDDLIVQHPALSLALSRALSTRLGTAEGEAVERHLRQLVLFNGLSQTELRQISQFVQPHRFRAGETICSAGQPAGFVYIIEAGEAREIAQGPNGQTVVLDLLGPQQSFGEQAVVQNGAYPVTVQSVGEIEVWAIAKNDFDRMLATFPALALSITRRMAQELERATKRAPRPQSAPPMRSGAQYGQPQYGQPQGQGQYGQPQGQSQQAYAPRNGNGGNGYGTNGGNGRNTYAPQNPNMQPQPQMRAQGAPLPGTSVGVRPAPSKPWERSGNVVRPMPAATARPVQQMVGAAHVGMAIRNRRPGIITWFSNLSVGNKIATILVAVFALWIVVMLPLWLLYAILTSSFGGGNGAPSPDLPLASSGDRPLLFGLKIAQAIKSPTPTPLPPTAVPPTAVPTHKPVVAAQRKVAATAVPDVAPADATPVGVAASIAPPLPPREWDSRLGAGGLPLLQGIGVTDAVVPSGQTYWRLIKMQFQDAGQESGNNHNVYVTVIDEQGKRVEDKVVEISWDESGAIEVQRLSLSDQKPKGDYCECNYNWPMYGAGYRAKVSDSIPSDQAYGMIMPEHRHVNYLLTFQRVIMP
jgi:CRP-like cAMP-binding protein